MANHRSTDRWLGIAAAIVLLIAAVLVVLPFFSALLWAAIVSITLWPLRDLMAHKMKLGRGLSAAFISIALLGLLVAPIAAASVLLANYTEDLLSQVRHLMQDGLPEPRSGSAPSHCWGNGLLINGPTIVMMGARCSRSP